jgi:ribosomal protein S27AE
MPFLQKVQRWCPKCEGEYTATVHSERIGKELSTMVMPCPDCGTPGQILADISATVRVG